MRKIDILRIVFILMQTVPTARAARIVREGHVVILSGKIEFGDVDRLNEVLTDQVDVLRVSSTGGLVPEAVKLGQIVFDRSLVIEVAGSCASACAQLLLPAAPRVRIADGSILMLVASNEAIVQSLVDRGAFDAPEFAQAKEAVAGFSQKHSTFQTLLGIDPQAGRFLVALTGPNGMELTATPGDAGPSLKMSATRGPLCRAWLLNQTTARAFGIKADPWKPAGRTKAAFQFAEKYDDIYDGPVLPPERLVDLADCDAVRRLASELR